jgi:hypothetical protein
MAWMAKVFGNIYLTEKQGAASFDADDEWALGILAAQAGVAVGNARLNEELEARVQRLDTLHAISAAIVQGEDPDAVTELVARQARALLQADLAGVAVPTRDGGELTMRTADGVRAGELLGEVFPSKGSVSEDVIAGSRVIELPDAAVDDRVAQPIVRSGMLARRCWCPWPSGASRSERCCWPGVVAAGRSRRAKCGGSSCSQAKPRECSSRAPATAGEPVADAGGP